MDFCRTFASSIRQKDNIIKVNLKIKERVTKMKKIVLTLVALMSMTTTFAENEGMNTTNVCRERRYEYHRGIQHDC